MGNRWGRDASEISVCVSFCTCMIRFFKVQLIHFALILHKKLQKDNIAKSSKAISSSAFSNIQTPNKFTI